MSWTTSGTDDTSTRRLMVPLWMPGKTTPAVRTGATLAPGRAVGGRIWEDYLASRGGR